MDSFCAHVKSAIFYIQKPTALLHPKRRKATKKQMANTPKIHYFTMNDESINCYGYRVLSNGIDLSAFKRNPVGFWNHQSDDDDMPICKWVSFEVKDGKLIGGLQVDTDDEKGVRLDSKISNGYVNAVSIYFDPIELSDAPEHILAGQRNATITKCLLLECSPVGLPGNYNAVKLKGVAGTAIALNNATPVDALAHLFNRTLNTNNTMTNEQKTLLGLAETATDEQVTEALKNLQAKATTIPPAVPPVPAEATTLSQADNAELLALRAERVSGLVDGAVTAGKITLAEKDAYTKLANGDFETTKKVMDAMKVVPKLSNFVGNTTTGGDVNTGIATKMEDCEFYKLSRTNTKELERIQAEEPSRFEALKNEYRALLK
jgi:hypothetical protein